MLDSILKQDVDSDSAANKNNNYSLLANYHRIIKQDDYHIVGLSKPCNHLTLILSTLNIFIMVDVYKQNFSSARRRMLFYGKFTSAEHFIRF